MPTYEYKCDSCGHTFEKFQNISAKPLSKCPQCGGKAQRLISGGAAVIFKGPGFYATDYGKTQSPGCGRDRPCCGRETPCEKKPCE